MHSALHPPIDTPLRFVSYPHVLQPGVASLAVGVEVEGAPPGSRSIPTTPLGARGRLARQARRSTQGGSWTSRLEIPGICPSNADPDSGNTTRSVSADLEFGDANPGVFTNRKEHRLTTSTNHAHLSARVAARRQITQPRRGELLAARSIRRVAEWRADNPLAVKTWTPSDGNGYIVAALGYYTGYRQCGDCDRMFITCRKAPDHRVTGHGSGRWPTYCTECGAERRRKHDNEDRTVRRRRQRAAELEFRNAQFRKVGLPIPKPGRPKGSGRRVQELHELGIYDDLWK